MIRSLKQIEAKTISKDEALKIIKIYLHEQKELALRKMLSDDEFTKDAWSSYIAHQLGYIKAIDKLITFIPDQGKDV